MAFILEPIGNAIDGTFDVEDTRCHTCELFAYCTKVGNGLAKLDALLGVLCGESEYHFSPSGTHCAEFEPSDIEHIEGHFMTASERTEEMRLGDAHVFEKHLTGRRTMYAHLVFFIAEGEPGAVPIDDKSAVLTLSSASEDDKGVGKARIGDPHLLAVEYKMRAIVRRGRSSAHAQGIGTRRGLGQAVRQDELRLYSRDQIALLLLLGTVEIQRQHPNTDVRRKRGIKRSSNATKYFRNESIGVRVEIKAAVFFTDMGSDQTELGCFAHQCAYIHKKAPPLCFMGNVFIKQLILSYGLTKHSPLGTMWSAIKETQGARKMVLPTIGICQNFDGHLPYGRLLGRPVYRLVFNR